MLIIFDVTPCSKVKYFSFWVKYNLIHLAKIQMLTFYARKGWTNSKKKKWQGEVIELIRKFIFLNIYTCFQYYFSHDYQKTCKFNTIIKINVTENIIHCISWANLHFVCINLRITIFGFRYKCLSGGMVPFTVSGC